jgi:hypothetical protein
MLGCSRQCTWWFTWKFSLCPLFEGNLVIVGEGIVVGVFVVIAVNTMMMAHFGVIISALADTAVSALMCMVLTHVDCLQWWADMWVVDTRHWEWDEQKWSTFCDHCVMVLEGFCTHCEGRYGRCVKEVVMAVIELSFSVFMGGCCYSNKQGWLWVVYGFWGSWSCDINRVFELKIVASVRLITCSNSKSREAWFWTI